MTVIVTQLSAGSRLFYGLDSSKCYYSAAFLGQNSENWVECCEEILFGFHRSCFWCLARDVAAAGLLFWVRAPVSFLFLLLLSFCFPHAFFMFFYPFFCSSFLSFSSRSLLYNSVIVINHHSNRVIGRHHKTFEAHNHFSFFSVSLVHA